MRAGSAPSCPSGDGPKDSVRLSVRHKLILFGTLAILVVSSGFTWVNLVLARRAIEEDFKTRAIVYAREVAAAIGGRRELESGPELNRLIARLLEIRTSVLQLDVLAFWPGDTIVVATNEPRVRLPFSRADAEEVRSGRIVSRAATSEAGDHREVMAPITLEGAVVGAVAVKFSTRRAEELADRIRFWALTLAAASLVLMGVLMSVAIHFVVDRPIRRFMDAISPAATDGVPATVSVATADEFGVLARHFNEMVARIGQFSDELRTRIAEATGELDRRYQQVEQLNALLFEMQRRLSHAERLALSGQVMAGDLLVVGHLGRSGERQPLGVAESPVPCSKSRAFSCSTCWYRRSSSPVGLGDARPELVAELADPRDHLVEVASEDAKLVRRRDRGVAGTPSVAAGEGSRP